MQKLNNNIKAIYKQAGIDWLKNLPELLNILQDKLEITIQKPFGNLSYHYVAPATSSSGAQLVLKCGIPAKNSGFAQQIAALRHFDGNGCAKLIDADVNCGWMLQERLLPGKVLSYEDDDLATSVALEIMQKLQQPANLIGEHCFQNVSDWLSVFDNFDNSNTLIPQVMFDRAKGIRQELLQSTGEVLLLHGDLHHENIISAKREPWLAIDPRGVIGEAEYEVGALMHNPKPQITSQYKTSKVLARRFDLIAERTNFDKQRLQAWSYVQAVMGACWCVQDGVDEVEIFISCADNLWDLYR